MKLQTIKEISEKWGLSERTIRKLCTEERIPEAELIRGIWMIPEDAYAVTYVETRLNPPIVTILSLAHAVRVLLTAVTIISAAVLKNKDAIPIFQFAFLMKMKMIKDIQRMRELTFRGFKTLHKRLGISTQPFTF